MSASDGGPFAEDVTIRVIGIEDPTAARTVELPDSMRAEFERIDTAHDSYGGCWECGAPVGWVLDDEASPTGALRWHAVWLASDNGGHTAAFCEACAPDLSVLPRNASASAGCAR